MRVYFDKYNKHVDFVEFESLDGSIQEEFDPNLVE